MAKMNPQPWDTLGEHLISSLTTPGGVSLDMLQDFAVSCADVGVTPRWVDAAFHAKQDEAMSLLALWSPYVDYLQSDSPLVVCQAPSIEMLVPPRDGADNPFYIVWATNLQNSREWWVPTGSQIQNRLSYTLCTTGTQRRFAAKRGTSIIMLVHDSDSQGVPIYMGVMNASKQWKAVMRRHLDKMTDRIRIYWLSLLLNNWIKGELSSPALRMLNYAAVYCEGLPPTTLNDLSYEDLLYWCRLVVDLRKTDGSAGECGDVMREHLPGCDQNWERYLR